MWFWYFVRDIGLWIVWDDRSAVAGRFTFMVVAPFGYGLSCIRVIGILLRRTNLPLLFLKAFELLIPYNGVVLECDRHVSVKRLECYVDKHLVEHCKYKHHNHDDGLR